MPPYRGRRSGVGIELLLIDFLHCGNREFHVFLRKMEENIKIFRSYRKKVRPRVSKI